MSFLRISSPLKTHVSEKPVLLAQAPLNMKPVPLKLVFLLILFREA